MPLNVTSDVVLPMKLPMQLNRNSFGHFLTKEGLVGDKAGRRHKVETGRSRGYRNGDTEDVGMEF